MIQRDVAINGVLMVLILGVAYLLVRYRQPELKGDQFAGEEEPPATAETSPVSPQAIIPLNHAVLAEVNPFRTIITPTPTPTPTPPPTPTPIPLQLAMSQFQLVMPDPPRSVTLMERSNANQFEWKVGETRAVNVAGQSLRVTLKLVDPNDFHAEFVAPPNQTFTFSLFGGPK